MRRGWRTGFHVFLFAGMLLGLSFAVKGAQPPPSIDDLHDTTWELTSKGVEYDLQGGSHKSDTTITTTITKTGDDTVNLSGVFGGMLFDAHYVGGFLVQSHASGESPPNEGSSLFLAVSGKPGKMKMKGQLTVFAAGPGFQVLRVLKVSAKQIVQ